jgi:hypothetical protein
MKNIINKLIKPKVTAGKIWDWYYYRDKRKISSLPIVKYQYDDVNHNYIASRIDKCISILHHNLQGSVSILDPLCTEGQLYQYSQAIRLHCLTAYAYMWYFSITGEKLFDEELIKGSVLPEETKKYCIISSQIDKLEKYLVNFAAFGEEGRYYIKQPSKPPRLPKKIEDFLEVIWYAYGILAPCCISGMQDRDLKEMKKWEGASASADKINYHIVKQFYSYDTKKNHNYIPKNLVVKYDNKNMRHSIYTNFYIWKNECCIDGDLFCTPLTKEYIERLYTTNMVV